MEGKAARCVSEAEEWLFPSVKKRIEKKKRKINKMQEAVAKKWESEDQIQK